MSAQEPIYNIYFNSGLSPYPQIYAFGYGQTNKVISLRVKPGLTSAIASFEVTLPDTGSSGESFNSISVFDILYIKLGYGSSVDWVFGGRIDSIKSEYSSTEGNTRTYIGRDFGEALFRYLEMRMYTGTASGSVVTIGNKCGLTVRGVEDSTNEYTIVADQNNSFEAIKEISNLDNRDFCIETGSNNIFWFERQSKTGLGTFVAGTNIFSYRYFQDLTDVRNQYYIFGDKLDSDTSGSYLPVDHDMWTEQDTTDYSVVVSSPGSSPTIGYATTDKVTGSASISATFTSVASDQTYTLELRKLLPRTIGLLSGDRVHLFYKSDWVVIPTGFGNLGYNVRLGCGSWDTNYFETAMSSTLLSLGWREATFEAGPHVEGVTNLLPFGMITGSYRWNRVGTPDWLGIDRFSLISQVNVDIATFNYLLMDNFYFETRFQWQTGSPSSVTTYGYRPELIIDSKYNSTEYCTNASAHFLQENSGSSIQIEVVTTGSPGLMLGYNYNLTIPSEGISNSAYTLIDLEHIYSEGEGFISKCLLSNKPQIRLPIPIIDYQTYGAVEKTIQQRYWESIGRLWAMGTKNFRLP